MLCSFTQVGAHILKDAVGNFVLEPAKDFMLHDGVHMMFDMMMGGQQ
jgi:hypothetical protein